MTFDNDKILSQYRELAMEDASAWDVLAGEDAALMAEEAGIPSAKWRNDRLSMQTGMMILNRELPLEAPQTEEEQKLWLQQMMKTVVKLQISSQLNCQDNDMARKGLLLQHMRTSGILEESDLAWYSRKEVSELQNILEKHLCGQVVPAVLSYLLRQCDLQSGESQEATQITNSGALALSTYLEVPEVRDCPQALGALGEISVKVPQPTVDSGSDPNPTLDAGSDPNFLWQLACGLLVVAILLVTAALLIHVTPLIGAVAGELLKGSVGSVGFAIVAETAPWTGIIAYVLKLALGSACLSALIGFMAAIADWCDYEPAYGMNTAIRSAAENQTANQHASQMTT